MTKLLSVLYKPYPLEERKPAQIKLAFIFGFVVFLFLLLLKPFGNNSSFNQVLLNSAIAGLLTCVAIIFDFIVLFPLFPQFFSEEKWTILREIIFTIIIITTIASFNVIAGVFIWHGNFSFANWLSMVFYTAVIGIAPATVSILINQARLLKKYRTEVAVINKSLPAKKVEVKVEPVSIVTTASTKEAPIITKTENTIVEKEETIIKQIDSPTQITIQAENEKDNLSLLNTNFLAATSADNYVKVYYQENGKLKTAIIRSTLKRVEENTADFPQFFRCHRTAIVNMSLVQSVNGSAQGYRLQLPYLPEEIPVSRNLNQLVKEKLAVIK
jgi:DNA-binding LytR/AlgR family response regulator